MVKGRGLWNTVWSSSVVFTQTLCGIYVFTKYGVFVSKVRERSLANRASTCMFARAGPVCNHACMQPQVDGPSMFPTFSGQGDIVLAEAVSRWLGKFSPGEVTVRCATAPGYQASHAGPPSDPPAAWRVRGQVTS